MDELTGELPTGARARNLDALLPRLPAHHVQRSRLAQGLLASRSSVTLLSAPAGFGKSVLLNECIRQASLNTRIVWLDLLGNTLSPAELLDRIASALQITPGEDDVRSELSHLLGNSKYPLWIILDDYPRQASPELDELLGTLLERTPHTLRWWIGCRRRPAWNLPRLQLQGDLQEVDAHALAFTERELSTLLQHRDVNCASETQAQILANSDGWPAAIGLTLIEGKLDTLTSDSVSPLLRDYVEREVLADIPAALLTPLQTLAHIPHFNAELCNHLLAGHDAEQLLVNLRAHHLLASDNDTGNHWVSLWAPLARVLRAHPATQSTQPTHVRACQWFAAQGDVREAVKHALWAGQPEVAASYLHRYGQDQLLVGESVSQFLHWRDEFPAELFSCTPRLVMLQVWALLICTRLDEAERCLAELVNFLPQPSAERQRRLLSHYQAALGVLHCQRGLPEAKQHCQEALELLEDESWSLRILCLQTLAQQATGEQQLTLGRQYTREALRLARANGNVVFEALLSADHIHQLLIMGEFEQAWDHTEESLQLLKNAGLRGPVLGRLQMLRGSILVTRGEPAQAKAALKEGIQEAEQCEDAYLLYGYLCLADLTGRDGQLDAAQQLLRTAERKMQLYNVPLVRYRDALNVAQGELWLLRGDAEKAKQVFVEVRERFNSEYAMPPAGFYDLHLRARFDEACANMALGDLDAARHGLQNLLTDCQQNGHHQLAVYVGLRLAETLWLEQRKTLANRQLAQSLGEAEQQQHLQPLLNLYQRQPEWLATELAQLDETTLWRKKLLQATDKTRTPITPSESPLSKREAAVLKFIARGHSNLQIAEAMFISVHTVKTHARRINTKLGVQRRTHAVAKAKNEGWLS
jgi:ATP/maltotriose-dependent transcriptional regulator MalT